MMESGFRHDSFRYGLDDGVVSRSTLDTCEAAEWGNYCKTAGILCHNNFSSERQLNTIPEAESIKTQGSLQLAIYVNYGMLTVHVIQGKQLKSMWNDRPICNSLVRLAILPDEEDITSCRSEVIPESNNPVFDEKFSFEVLPEQSYKRLYISVWHVEDSCQQVEFLGCMSFGLKHVIDQNKLINGWYYLLTEDIGHRKHLKLATVTWGKVRTKLHDIDMNVSDHNISEEIHDKEDKEDKSSATTSGSSNPDNLWTDTYEITIKRAPNGGFGFTLTGGRPVKVCHVELDSCAEVAGLHEDDQICKVNGQDVYYITTQEVASLIRCWRHGKLVLEVQRPYKINDFNSMMMSNHYPREESPVKNVKSIFSVHASGRNNKLSRNHSFSGSTASNSTFQPPQAPQMKKCNSLSRNSTVYRSFTNLKSTLVKNSTQGGKSFPCETENKQKKKKFRNIATDFLNKFR